MVSDLPTLFGKRYSKTLRHRPPRNNNLDLCHLQATYETGVDTVQLQKAPVAPHHQVRWDVPPPSWIKEANTLYWNALLLHRILGWIVKMKAVKAQRSVPGAKSTVLLNLDTNGLYTKTFSMRPYCQKEDGTWARYHSDLTMKLDKSSAVEYLVRRYLSEVHYSLIIDQYHRPALVQFSAGVEEGTQPTVGDRILFHSTFHMALCLLGRDSTKSVHHSVITRFICAPKHYRMSTWFLGVDVVPEEREEIAFISNVQDLKLVVSPSRTRDEMIQRMLPTANDRRPLPIVFKNDSAGCYKGRVPIARYISKPPVVPEIRNPSTKPALIFELLEQADPVFETALVHSAKVYVGKHETEPRRLPLRRPVLSSDMKTFEASIFSVTGEETVSSLREFGQVLHDAMDTVTRHFRDRFDLSEYCALLDVCRGDEEWVVIVNSLCDKSRGRKYDDALYRRMAQFVTRNDPNGFCKFVDLATSNYIQRRVDVWTALLGLDVDNPTKVDLLRAVKTRGPPEDERDGPDEVKIKIKKGKRRVGPRPATALPVATALTYGDGTFTLDFRGKQITWTTQHFRRCTGASQLQMDLYQVPKSTMEAQELMIESLVKVEVQKSERTLSVEIHKNFEEPVVTESYDALDKDALAEMCKSKPEVTRKWISLPQRATSKIKDFVLNEKFPPLPKRAVTGTKPYYERIDSKINYVSNGVTTTVAQGEHIRAMVGSLVRVSGKQASVFHVLEGAAKYRSVSQLRRDFGTIVTQLDYVGVEWKLNGNFTVARKMANDGIKRQLSAQKPNVNYRAEVCNTAPHEYFNPENTVLDRPPERTLPKSTYLTVPCLAYYDIDPRTLNAAGKNSNIRLLDHNVVRHNVYNVDAKFQRAEMNFLSRSKVTRLQLKPLKVPAPREEDSHFQLRTVNILVPREPHSGERGLKLKTTWKRVATDTLVNKELYAKQLGCEKLANERTTNARRPPEGVVVETAEGIGRRRLPVAADFPDGKLPFTLNMSYKLTSYTISVIDLVDRDGKSVVKGVGVSDVGISTAHSIYDPDNGRFWEFGRGATGFLCDTLAKKVDKAKSAGNVAMARLFERALRARVRRLHEVWLAATLALFSEFVYSFSTTAGWMKSELSKRTHRRAGILSLCTFHDKLIRATSSPKSTCTLVDLGDERYTTCVLSCCGTRLHNVGCSKVLYCHRCRKFIPRDFNGAVNCYRLYIARKELDPNDLINEGGPTQVSLTQ